MIPILFEKDTTDFSTNGIGRLSDAISCTVTLEANGGYELAMTYPMTGEHFTDIQMDSIIVAKPDGRRNNQAFRVYKISKPLNGQVAINAEHISYQLSQIPVSPFSATSAADALTGLKNHAAVDCPFTFWTDKASSGDFAVAVPVSIRSTLGGTEGSLLDVYGGEYDFDMYTVRLYEKQGQDNGVSIRYGKNLMDLTQEESISNTITGIMPYWTDSDGNVVTLDSKVVMSDAAENYPYPRIAVIDFSSEIESQPTQPQLQQAAEDYIERNNIGVPSISLSVSFAQLWQTEEYKDIAPLEEVAVFDTVTVQFEELGVDAKAEIRKTVYDVLLDRYNSVEIGDARSNLSTTIAEQQEKIDKVPTTTAMQHAIQNATELITGNKGGYLIFRYDANGQPYEMLIMDTPDINTATKVWRWNQGGLGYSENGYDGPYTTAITQDGAIVADFITAGTMLANIIHGGTLTLGGQGNGNGVCRVLDANGNEVIRLDNAGIKILKGLLQIGTLFSVDTDGNVVANSLKSSNAQITGGSIQIQAMAEYYEPIKLSTDDGWSIAMGPNGVTSRSPNGTYSRVSPAGVDTGTYSGTAMTLKASMTPEGSILAQNAYDNVTSESPNVNVLINGLFRRSASSSQKYKMDITDVIPEKLNPERLYEIPVKSFKYKEGYLAKDDQRARQDIIGFIAEEVAEVYPQAVNYVNGEPEMWNAQILIPAMMKLLQSQNERIKRLECQL